MKKKNGYLILGIVLAVFTVVAFVAPFIKTPVFWISYLFGLVAICFQIPLWNRALNGESLKSKFLGFSALYIGVTYLIIQLIISLIMMVVSGIPVWITIIVDVMLLTIIYTLVISSDVAKTAIEITEEKVQIKTAFLKSVKADIDILLSEEEDLEIKKELDKLSNDIKYSDPVSSSELEEIEQLIIDKIADFSTIGEHKTYQVAKIRELVKQRNIKCRALK